MTGSHENGALIAAENILGWLISGDGYRWLEVTADQFHKRQHRLLFAEIAALHAKGQPHDPQTVSASLAHNGNLKAAGGERVVQRLADNTIATEESIGAYVGRLRSALDASQPPDDDAPAFDYSDEPRANGHAEETPPFLVRRLDEIHAESRVAVIQGLGFDEGAVAAIVGAPNAGKTALAVSVALAVASRAERWLNLKVAGGPAVYFAAEAPASVILRARAAAERIHAAHPPALYVSDAAPAVGGEFTSVADAERVIATITAVQSTEGERVRLVFLDTLASCLGDGDENSDGMLRLVAAAKQIALRTAACVVLVHHPSKGDAGGLRGHGSLAAACDSIVRIEADELSGVRTATLVKARDHGTGLQLRFELEPVTLPERDSFGDPRTAIVVRATSQPAPRPRPSGRRQEQLLAELERRYRTGERHWDEATLRRAGRDLGMPRNSPADATRALIKAGFLAGPPSALALKHPPPETPA